MYLGQQSNYTTQGYCKKIQKLVCPRESCFLCTDREKNDNGDRKRQRMLNLLTTEVLTNSFAELSGATGAFYLTKQIGFKKVN